MYHFIARENQEHEYLKSSRPLRKVTILTHYKNMVLIGAVQRELWVRNLGKNKISIP
jgi:hypothetical protein